MKPLRDYTIRAASLGAACLACAGALYLAFDAALGPENGPGSGAYHAKASAYGAGGAPDEAIPVDRALMPSLPNNWQAQWQGGLLWITRYNPNGSVADCLPFNDLDDYHHWVYAHPDFCDVNAEKVARHAP